MDALTALKTRRACRDYTDELPSRQQIESIIEAGLYAPSGMGQQSAMVIAVTNKEIRDELSCLNAQFIPNYSSDPFYGAPVVLIVLAKKEVKTHVYDGALLLGNLMNAAHAIGLATCWIHRAKEMFETDQGKAILKKLGITEEYVGIGNCILGFRSGDTPQVATRKDQRVFYID